MGGMLAIRDACSRSPLLSALGNLPTDDPMSGSLQLTFRGL